MGRGGVAAGTAARWAAGAVTAAALAAALWWGTYVVGGSDSYCYVSQAGFWVTGALFEPQPVGFTPPWPHADLSLTPTGYIPSPTTPGAIAPLCPAGLSLAMVPFWAAAGPSAVFLVVPILAALAVWLSYCLGRALHGPAAGVLAATLVAASPIVLRQSFQPMSDVPAAAWWLAAIVLAGRGGHARAFVSGLAVSAAVMTRPNMAPLAGVVALLVALRPGEGPGKASRAGTVAAFCAGVLPGALAVAWIQEALYGSPFSSGYGALGQLFAWSHVRPNLRRFPAWLLATHTPLVLLSLAAPFVLPTRRQAWLAATCLVFAAAVLAAYVAYIPYDEWWYLRFLLPAIPPLLATTAAALAALGARLPARARAAAWAACAIALVAFFVHTARERDVFRLRDFERRFRVAGEYVAARLPEEAVVLAVWESGSVRHYGRKLSISYDQIEPAWLDRAVAFLESQGRPPYLLVEAWEEAGFRARFEGHSPLGSLDWPPVAQIGREVRLYRLSDRVRYYAGESIPTEMVLPAYQRRPPQPE